MIPLKVLTLIVLNSMQPAALVMEPIEEHQRTKSRIVPVWVGPAEAMQLGMAVEHMRTPRPLTHDLMLDALTNLDARIDHAVINDVKGTTFFAKLYLKQGDRMIELDARPSDAIALAIREDAPIYIDERTLDEGSYPYIIGEDAAESEIEEFHSFLENISPEDFQA